MDLAEELEDWVLEGAYAVSANGNVIVGEGVKRSDLQNGGGGRPLSRSWRVVLDERPDPVLLPGDANLDGAVDLADFDRIKEWFGRGAFWYQGDFNDDLHVDLNDFAVLKANFGAEATPAPEPGAVYLALAAIGVLIARRKFAS